MKIRTDFVTNSSSSSFVAVNVSTGTLDTYLSENGLEDIFDNLEYLCENGEAIQAELGKSVSQSLIAILEKIAEELEYGSFSEELIGADEEAVRELIKFIKKNKKIIDAEAECDIELKYSCGEDGYAYVQSLVCKDHHGKLTKWPCADGWNYQDGGGYEQIQNFNAKMFNGEIQELMDLAYDAIWDIIWDDDALNTAINRTGIVEEFEAPQSTGEEKANFEKDLKLDEIDPINLTWIKDALFVFTGLTENDESIASDIVEDNGGVIKSSVVLKTNYVIYNPYYDHETTKLKKAKELIEKGKNIQLLTVSDFCKMLMTLGTGEMVKAPEKKSTPIPTTMKECSRIFECYISSQTGRVSIRGIKKSTEEIIIPGVIDGMPVEVEQGAFGKNKKLEKITFAEGVEAIGADNFNDCKLLREVVFASTIKKVGAGLFKNTPWISAQGDWLIINNILVTYLGNAVEVRIPDGITCINDYAFAWNSSIRKLIIPESVSYIGDSAFTSCRNLKEIQLPENHIEFGSNPFDGTAWANSQNDWVIIAGTLLGMTDDYYYGNLMKAESFTIPDGVREIGKNAFMAGIRDWKQIKSVRLPDGLEEIGDKAFYDFKGLEELVLPTSVAKIGEYAFYGCTALSRMEFPNGLKEIGRCAFSGMSGWNDRPSSAPNIEEIVLPDTVETIGRSAFAYCEGLKKLVLPKKTEIIPNALCHSCKNLHTLEMPEKCRIIDDDAFESCVNITNIKMPTGVESMGRRVFYGCISLQGLELPESIMSFSWATFKRCDSMTKIDIPEGVTELPEELFLHCDSLESIKVPASVTSIQGRVFDECPKLTVTVGSGSFGEEYVKKNKIPYIVE